MTQRGAYANRNAGHKARQAQLFAGARDDGERLAAAYGWLRFDRGPARAAPPPERS